MPLELKVKFELAIFIKTSYQLLWNYFSSGQTILVDVVLLQNVQFKKAFAEKF